MGNDNYLKMFSEYAERMKEIRMLSTPNLYEIKDADEYSGVLVDNFSKIGRLAAQNRTIINDILKPMLNPDVKLNDEMQSILKQFDEMLVNANSFEEVDVHLSEVINGILMNHDINGDDSLDENQKVINMGRKVKRDYFFVSMLNRYNSIELDEVRKKAIDNRNKLALYLEKDVFVKLSAAAKGAALQYSLMGALFYYSNLYTMPDSWWSEALSIFEQAEEILRDPFYQENYPDYDWESYEFRTYYYGSFMAHSIIPEEVAKKVYIYAEKTVEFLEKTQNKAILAAIDIEGRRDLRDVASVLAGYTPARKACDIIYDAYEKRNKEDYTVSGLGVNLNSPSLYLRIANMKDMQLNERDYDRIKDIQNSVLDYLYSLPKRSNIYMKCVTLLTNFPVNFIEVPGCMSLEEFCVKAFACIHPPTYVHVNMVARFAKCMAGHLLESQPERFIGFPGCKNVSDVQSNRETILNYTYHSALCHDLGKLFIIDVVSMYGRNLLDDEFSMIKSHPITGAMIAAMHSSTREYEDVIKGHHIWYDCSKGYPSDFDTFKSPYKTVIDIVLAADCLDAATDTVGRSYNRGKTFEEYEKEIIEGAGTHYAPFLVDLFKRPEVRDDMTYLLGEGRNKMYRELYILLKNNTK
ncbi:MAG: hypothetical protein K6F97_07150, partial [Lachnospiraceae bacterium]|nr:hypothetical protein [Lachnospiraceae bacterium]